MEETAIAALDILIATRMTDAVLHYLENGGRVLWLESGEEYNCRAYTSYPQVDYYATVIAGHPVTAAFPNEGWCDLQFHNITGTAVLDLGFFAPGRWPAIIEALQTPFSTSHPIVLPFRRKGFLAEAQVGSGRLLVTTFDLSGLGTLPEADSMFNTLLNYLLAPLPEVACTLSGEEMRQWAWGSTAGEPALDWIPFQG